LPVVVVFFDGDQEKALKVIVEERALETKENSPFTTNNLKLTSILDNIKKENPELEFKFLQIKHFDREDAIMAVALENSKTFAGDGSLSITLRDGKTVADYLPGKKTYSQSILYGIARLHFATFGGLILKTIYFLLALLTCFIIISGVLLWKEARNKKSYTDKQKRFHHRVTMSYLAICFGLFPAVAVLFNAELLVPDIEKHVFLVRTVFFVSWLIFTTVGIFSKNEAKATQLYLYLGAIFSIIVPVTNGIITNDWIWIALAKGNYFVAGTDIFWFITGIISLTIAFSVSGKELENKISRKVIKEEAESTK